jgi:hypothetical protein
MLVEDEKRKEIIEQNDESMRGFLDSTNALQFFYLCAMMNGVADFADVARDAAVKMLRRLP